jgi:hypothetical protein
MHKRILIIYACWLFNLNLYAQDQFSPSTYIGIGAGACISRVSFTPVIKQDLVSSSSISFFFRHISEPNIGLQVELNYHARGWIENLDSIGKYKRKMQVLDLPVLAAFVAGKKIVRFAFTIGPYLSYMLHEKETISIIDTIYFRKYYLKPLDNKWEFGFLAGLALELHTKVGAFGIKVQYANGLSNLFPLNSKEFYFNGSRCQVIHAGLTYFINI